MKNTHAHLNKIISDNTRNQQQQEKLGMVHNVAKGKMFNKRTTTLPQYNRSKSRGNLGKLINIE